MTNLYFYSDKLSKMFENVFPFSEFVRLTTLSRSSMRLLVTIRRPWISVIKSTNSSQGWRHISDEMLLTFAPPVNEAQDGMLYI